LSSLATALLAVLLGLLPALLAVLLAAPLTLLTGRHELPGLWVARLLLGLLVLELPELLGVTPVLATLVSAAALLAWPAGLLARGLSCRGNEPLLLLGLLAHLLLGLLRLLTGLLAATLRLSLAPLLTALLLLILPLLALLPPLLVSLRRLLATLPLVLLPTILIVMNHENPSNVGLASDPVPLPLASARCILTPSVDQPLGGLVRHRHVAFGVGIGKIPGVLHGGTFLHVR